MATTDNYERVDQALALLRAARDLLDEAGAKKSTVRVRSAIASALGARRHARNEPYRQARRASCERT